MESIPWYLSTGFLGGIGLALSALVTLIVYAAQVATGSEVFDPSRLVQLVMGVVQAVAAVLLIVWRVRKGLDPASPSPRIAGGSPPVGPAALALLVPAGLLALMLVGCGPSLIAPETPAQTEAACEGTLALPGTWYRVARPHLAPEGAAKADEGLALLERARPLLCEGIRIGLEEAARRNAQASARQGATP